MPTSKTSSNTQQNNPLEKLRNFDDDSAGSNLFDQLIGKRNTEKKDAPENSFEKSHSFGRQHTEFTIFSHNTYKENELIPREIEGLKEEIRTELKNLKAANSELVQEAVEIEKAAMQTTSEKAGIYQVRFLEVLLSMLRDLRSKVGEAGTWMKALQSKKKKRGSLFASTAKKKGTQYSQSQELQNARSIQ